MRRSAWAWLFMAAWACGDTTTEPEPEFIVRVGYIGALDEPYRAPLLAPTTVPRGHPVALTVTTYGPPLCTRPAGAEVAYPEPSVVEVVPYDSFPAGNPICPTTAAPYPRAVMVAFPRTGDATIRLIAESFDPEAVARRRDTLELAVTVYEPEF